MKDPTSQSVSYEESKKSDAAVSEQPQAGIFWRLGSGLYSTTTGAIGLGYGAVKYTAQTGYAVASKTAEVGVNATKAVASGGYNAVTGSVSAVTNRMSKQKDKKE